MSNSTEEIERKLNQALQLLQEATAALGELKRGEGPAQVMSRIQGAQAAAAKASVPPLSLVPHARKTKERAAFYLHIAEAAHPSNDKVLRVLGDSGLVKASKMEAELKPDPSYEVERLNSRQWQALRETRLMAVRQGAMNVGTMQAEDLR